MSDRHYSTEYEWFERVGAETVPDDEPVPICPECGALVRRDLDEQHGWRCDLHGPHSPEWVYIDDGREVEPEE